MLAHIMELVRRISEDGQEHEGPGEPTKFNQAKCERRFDP